MIDEARYSGGPLSRAFRALSNRDFRFVWPGTVLFQIAWWMQVTVLGWLVLDLTDSAFMVALIGVFGWAPMLVLGLVGGVLADSVNRASLLKITHTTSLAASIVLAVLVVTDTVDAWHAYAVMLVVGSGRALDQSARRALIHDLLGTQGVTNALALDSTAAHGSKAVGPALAGGLIALAGVAAGYVATTLVFGSAATLMWMVREHHRPDSGLRFSGMAANVMAGLRYAVTHPVIVGVMSITLLVNVLLYQYVHMIPVIARDELGVGAARMGAMLSADGIGALAGTIAVASVPLITHHGRIFIAGSLVGLAALCLVSFSHQYFFSLAAIVFIGLGSAGFSTMQGTIVTLVARREMRGRSLGAISLAVGASPMGALTIGAMGSAAGPLLAVRLHGFLGLALVALVALVATSLRGRILPATGGSGSRG